MEMKSLTEEEIKAWNLAHEIKRWWNTEKKTDPMSFADEVNYLLFSKVKHAVPEDLWFSDVSQPGDGKSIETMVSSKYTLQRLKNLLEVRERWLAKEGLPPDFWMRDGPGLERDRFIKDCRQEYEKERTQVTLYTEQVATLGKGKANRMARSRWHREMQRRAGSMLFWQAISFTGKFDVDFLKCARASQPCVLVSPASKAEKKKLHLQAVRARDEYRYGKHLSKIAARSTNWKPKV
jgi:hypothetical protein